MFSDSKEAKRESDSLSLHIDIETYSPVDLAKNGVYKYAADPDFKILLFAYAYGDEPVQIVDLDNGEEIPEQVIYDLKCSDISKIAYNSSFERICLSSFLNMDGYLNPSQWKCAYAQSLYCGVGMASLKQMGLFLGVDAQKLEEGKDLIKKFSVPLAKKQADIFGKDRLRKEDSPEEWELFKEYCKRDVESEREIWNKARAINPMPQREWDIYALDQRINDRGLYIDQDLIEDVIAVQNEFNKDKLEQIEKLAPGLNIKSTKQMLDWLNEHGADVSRCDKQTIEQLAESAQGEVKEICQLRLALNKNALKKYQSFMDACSEDSRARGLFLYFGAHTGRWTSKRVNIQNLPRPSLYDHAGIRELVKKRDYQGIEEKYGAASHALSSIIRTVITSPDGLSVCDFSAIEARLAAYLTDEDWQIQAFNNGEDIYCSTASMMYGVPVEKHGKNEHLRKLGKIAVLGANYQGGWRALKTQNPKMEDEDLKTIVQKYRSSVSHITGMWTDLESAARAAIETGERQEVKHGISFFMNGEHLLCELPSGRKLCYPKASVDEDGQIHFHDIGGGGERESTTYGGKLFENIVSAIARDCLCTALLRIDSAGLPIIGHVHDEVIVEGQCLDQLEKIFSSPVPYLQGLQLKGDGFEGEYYRKD